MFKRKFNQNDAEKEINKGKKEAEDILNNSSKLETFLAAVSKKFRTFKDAKDTIKKIPVLLELLKMYAKKEYTKAPKKTLIAIVSALIYFLSPIDVIPDFIPGIGMVDDALVITTVLKWVNDDLRDFIAWKNNRR